jgi:hypothetical protein
MLAHVRASDMRKYLADNQNLVYFPALTEHSPGPFQSGARSLNIDMSQHQTVGKPHWCNTP